MIGQLIEKEQLSQFKFIAAPEDKSATFKEKLEAATRLGNEFKAKTEISFLTDAGPKRIETTIWSFTEKYLQIKSGVSIPLKSILEIDY